MSLYGEALDENFHHIKAFVLVRQRRWGAYFHLRDIHLLPRLSLQ